MTGVNRAWQKLVAVRKFQIRIFHCSSESKEEPWQLAAFPQGIHSVPQSILAICSRLQEVPEPILGYHKVLFET